MNATFRAIDPETWRSTLTTEGDGKPFLAV